MQFETRKLGRTAAEVTTLGLGGATLGGNQADLTDADAKILCLEAFDSGIRYFDTAPFYGYGRSERLVGDSLRDLEGWTLSTKVGRRLRPRKGEQNQGDDWRQPLPFEPYFDYSYDGVMRSYEDSLQRLGLNRIDILYIHDIDTFTHGAETQPKMHAAAMDGAAKALDELRSSGEIKAIGIGVNEARPIADALSHAQWDCFLLAGRYTLLEQEPLESMLPAVEKHGASIVVGGPFNSGILVGRETWNYIKAPDDVMTRVKAIARVCDAHGVPLPAAALRFPLAHPAVASIIPGPRSAEELSQILEWWETDIPGSLWSDLKNEKLIAATAPVPA
ncbi:MAG: aldo/keto reductase [Bauldia sp.]|uniref:aldo/keto reductase n=1 Tax=Bauldia sp. TaxID=2575872 RepID=UPI001E16FE87|nr:aldo/keto reductase [Bauldia sp.]MCB1494518.1 aldo/keto reductase [Bauldia sp.]